MKIFILSALIFQFTSAFSQASIKKIEDNRFIKYQNNKSGVVDSLDNIIVPFIYERIEYKNQRLIAVKNKLAGLYTINNREILPIQNQWVLPRKHNRFIVWVNDSTQGLSDNDGNIILPISYKRVSSIGDDYYYTKNFKGLQGVYDYNGKEIFAEAYTFFTIDNLKIFATKNDQSLILDIENPDNILVLNKGIDFIETQRHYSSSEFFSKL